MKTWVDEVTGKQVQVVFDSKQASSCKIYFIFNFSIFLSLHKNWGWFMENMFMNLDRYFDSNVSERKDEGWKGVLVYDGQTDEQALLIIELLLRLKMHLSHRKVGSILKMLRISIDLGKSILYLYHYFSPQV